jgi:hypothetical protein
VDGTGSGSCPITDFGFSGVEPSGCAAVPDLRAYLKSKYIRDFSPGIFRP